MNQGSDPAPYFLGSTVLIAETGSSTHKVIDGQQRLTTLTILFCVLRELAQNKETKDSLDQRIRESADKFAGSKNRYRLQLRERDEEFFRDNVQEPGRIDRFLSQDLRHHSDARQLILASTRLLHTELSEKSEDERDKLAEFVIGHCYLVAVQAYDKDAAHRIFSVLNARGQDLLPTDILKADVIGGVPANAGEAYTKIWEDIEDELGRDRFLELFAHMFVIETGDRAHRELAKEFEEKALSKYTAIEFVDTVLSRYATAFQTVTQASYTSSRHAEDVNKFLGYLGRLLADNFDWVPPAMAIFNRFESEPETLLKLMKGLDRLAYIMFITGVGRDARISRYAPAISAVKEGAAPMKSCPALHRVATNSVPLPER